jgi:hypothetical protein
VLWYSFMSTQPAGAYRLQDPVIEFVPEHSTDQTFGVRFTTESAFAEDPRDEGFVLELPKVALRVLSTAGMHVTAAISAAVYASCEIEGLVILPPRA